MRKFSPTCNHTSMCTTGGVTSLEAIDQISHATFLDLQEHIISEIDWSYHANQLALAHSGVPRFEASFLSAQTV